MATACFHDRIDRIARNQTLTPSEVRPRRMDTARKAKRSNRKPAKPLPQLVARNGGSILPLSIGAILGAILGIILTGLTAQGSAWGPGTAAYGLVTYPALAGLALSPILVLTGFLLRKRRPGLLLFALAYFFGVVASLAL
ncbi:hypothetical protein [Sulfitobacter sabulilitoris]|uniref:Uncharacterized protein n=1 Tax=Sulfitobacter sabulilitoris TaxID=2562655 RepID=A0A5S3PJB2_9RHOB|nr:hypothetical protein [Sulfitobacter sabulilitoris]TMM54463.1 hypothetical protein FDT80_02395 [Sulfitobacter sabulilitoris]